MSTTSTWTIAGVPEHFNLPWYELIHKQSLVPQGIHLQWQDYPGGTGAMLEALHQGKADVIIALTEGIVKEALKPHSQLAIIGIYVESPLQWGCFVRADAPYEQMSELTQSTYAVSRLGSGSHLMAMVEAQQRGQNLKEEQFKVVGGIEGAVKAIQADEAQVILWERWMTQPYVAQGLLKRIDICPTPWPCFLMAANKQWAHKQAATLKQLHGLVSKEAQALRLNPALAQVIAQRFGLLETEAEAWLQNVRWSTQAIFSEVQFRHTANTLMRCGATPMLSEAQIHQCYQEATQL
ncbi:ABC transporter substrate-binding protein [Eisenibacter elegans]|jgi:ABC-type nitrate/sulfonate/bicarbonate transport system substrate-binding protein|uniref:ABC transporter substrate-binding protein n=1 Tax=Eisenibacter elegans TaxID=997 RepID=UPI0004184F18|nr:ABC transporter substrate-binding protein [Eisenibacter elegans]